MFQFMNCRGRAWRRGEKGQDEDEGEEDERDEVNREAVLAEAEVGWQQRFVAPSLQQKAGNGNDV